MNVGILSVASTESVSSVPDSVFDAIRVLELKGHVVTSVMAVANHDKLADVAEFYKSGVDALIVTGDTDAFRARLCQLYALQDGLSCFEIDGIIYLLAPALTPAFILKTGIPALNSKCKTFYNSIVIRTFGVALPILKERLVECVRNKNRIGFRFMDAGCGECEIRVCFSKKTNDVNAMIARVVTLLSDCIFTARDETLAAAVIAKLAERNKTLSLAESFTGGGIARNLVAVSGASQAFKDGIVCYSNDSKQNRLKVSKRIIEDCGAVSVETAYEMAANALISSGCDYSVATTGNAGPSSEKEGQEGMFFVAVGSKKGVHVFKESYKSDRNSVIEYGIKSALFKLYQNLCADSEN